MQFSTFMLIAATTATSVLAAPAASAPKEFQLDFSNELLSLVANPISTNPPNGQQYYLEALAPSAAQKAPKAFLSNKDLIFDAHNVFSIGYDLITTVKDVGDAPGAVFPVMAFPHLQKNGDYPQWASTSDGRITHEKAAALNTFFICKATVNGRETEILNWGNPTADLQAPAGCRYTTLHKN